MPCLNCKCTKPRWVFLKNIFSKSQFVCVCVCICNSYVSNVRGTKDISIHTS